MKKKIAVSILVILLMICAESVVFGDVVYTDPIIEYVYDFGHLLGFIGIIVLIISLMSLLILKVVTKKNKDNNLNKERKIKAKNKLQTIIYVSIIILTIAGIMVLYSYHELLEWTGIFCIIPLILIIISIIFRGKRNKKVSNIILRNSNNNNLYYGINNFFISYIFN